MSNPRIAVVICTAGRPDALALTLVSLAATMPPRRSAWEVLIVDNRPDHRTERVVHSFRDRLPIAYVREPTPGLSRARNTGIATANGDYFLWTDDDVTVGAAWLRRYEDAFERHPGAAFFGGPIRPRLEGQPPRWLTLDLPCILGAYAGLELSAEEKPLDGDLSELPFGANLAVRGTEQRAHRYDSRLGRQPGRTMLSGEESDVLQRVVAAGGRGVWLPEAVVEHRIDRTRQSTRYLRRYYDGCGVTQVLRARLQGRPDPSEHERILLSRLAQRLAREYLIGRMLARPSVWVPVMTEWSRLRGKLRAYRNGLPASGRERRER